ncbi:hypothetical protein Tco_0518016 [Tanacetum coccineum]
MAIITTRDLFSRGTTDCYCTLDMLNRECVSAAGALLRTRNNDVVEVKCVKVKVVVGEGVVNEVGWKEVCGVDVVVVNDVCSGVVVGVVCGVVGMSKIGKDKRKRSGWGGVWGGEEHGEGVKVRRVVYVCDSNEKGNGVVVEVGGPSRRLHKGPPKRGSIRELLSWIPTGDTAEMREYFSILICTNDRCSTRARLQPMCTGIAHSLDALALLMGRKARVARCPVGTVDDLLKANHQIKDVSGALKIWKTPSRLNDRASRDSMDLLRETARAKLPEEASSISYTGLWLRIFEILTVIIVFLGFKENGHQEEGPQQRIRSEMAYEAIPSGTGVEEGIERAVRSELIKTSWKCQPLFFRGHRRRVDFEANVLRYEKQEKLKTLPEINQNQQQEQKAEQQCRAYSARGTVDKNHNNNRNNNNNNNRNINNNNKPQQQQPEAAKGQIPMPTFCLSVGLTSGPIFKRGNCPPWKSRIPREMSNAIAKSLCSRELQWQNARQQRCDGQIGIVKDWPIILRTANGDSSGVIGCTLEALNGRVKMPYAHMLLRLRLEKFNSPVQEYLQETTEENSFKLSKGWASACERSKGANPAIESLSSEPISRSQIVKLNRLEANPYPISQDSWKLQERSNFTWET